VAHRRLAGAHAVGHRLNAMVHGIADHVLKWADHALEEVAVRGVDPESLVVAWLGALLQLEQSSGFLARRLEVRLAGAPPTSLAARAWGEPFDPGRHPRRVEVKAATYHRLRVDLARGRARVIVDI
jgi:SHS2 domain-containing protein